MRAEDARRIVISDWNFIEEEEIQKVFKIIKEASLNGLTLIIQKKISKRVVLKLKTLGYNVSYIEYTIPINNYYIIDWS